MEASPALENPPSNSEVYYWPWRIGRGLLGSQRGEHLCVSSVILIPCLFLATFIMCLLGTRYEHLAELAEFMLNYTLIVSRQSAPPTKT